MFLFRQDAAILHNMADSSSDQYVSPVLMSSFLTSNFTMVSDDVASPRRITYSVDAAAGPARMTVMAWNGVSFRSRRGVVRFRFSSYSLLSIDGFLNSRRVFSLMVRPAAINCSAIVIGITNEGGDKTIGTRFVFRRMQDFTLIGRIRLRCNGSSETRKSWKGFVLTSAGNDVLKEVHIAESSKSSLHFRRESLPVGHYLFMYTVQVIGMLTYLYMSRKSLINELN